MINEQECQQSFIRIVSISWIIVWPSKPSQGVLIREFLRRNALWSRYIKDTKNWPFLDVAAQITSENCIPQDFISRVRQHLTTVVPYIDEPGDMSDITPKIPNVVEESCISYLKWSAVCNSSSVVSLNLPNPYEPLIRFYERGGILYNPEERWFSGTAGGFSRDMNTWLATEQSIPIDISSLEAIDADED